MYLKLFNARPPSGKNPSKVLFKKKLSRDEVATKSERFFGARCRNKV